MYFTRSPFICKVDNNPKNTPGEFLELIHNAENVFCFHNPEDFCSCGRACYPQLNCNVLKIPNMFSSAYLYKSSFFGSVDHQVTKPAEYGVSPSLPDICYSPQTLKNSFAPFPLTHTHTYIYIYIYKSGSVHFIRNVFH